jgi:FAD/FMN-containing dehydrogenase
MSAELFEKLAARLGSKGFTTESEALAPHLVEWRGKHRGHSPCLALPQSTEEVRDVVRLCAAAGVAITPQGGNTGLVGGQIPQGEVLVSLKRMNRIRATDSANDSLVAEAGLILTNAQQSARDSGRMFPLSLASEGSATIGGLISTNAGGVHVLRYGMMRDLVLGIEAVLPDGSVFDGLKGLRKDNTGYDLKQLFIGAEGTLGIVTAATLKLFPRLLGHAVALAAVATPEHALALLHRLKGETGAVSAFEIMNRLSVDLVIKNVPNTRDPMPGAPYIVLVEFETARADGLRALIETALSGALDAGDAENVLIAENAGQARDFWAIRELISAGHRPEGAQVNHDISVPVSKTPAFLAEANAAAAAMCPGVRIVAFGHMGDGNFHYTLMQPSRSDAERFPGLALAERVNIIATDMGGSISAEHGIGTARVADLARFKSPESLTLMRAIKRAIDPLNVMNPRVLLQ